MIIRNKVLGVRFGLVMGFAFLVISSTIVNYVNPEHAVKAAASPSIDPTSMTVTPSAINQDGSDFTTQAALGSVSARPTNNIVNTKSFYDVVFVTGKAGVIKFIQVTFPAGTTVPTTASFNEAEGIGPGFISDVTGQTITYAVNNAVNIPAGTKIRLEFSNINNPINPNANYKITVTTRNAANTPIDGPTQSTAYAIKQIGPNVIADNSITSTKPAESFMKSVILVDNSASNLRGWNPNGVTTNFVIDEPAITGCFSSNCPYVSATVWNEVTSTVNHFCDVVDLSSTPSQFQLSCSSAPAENDQLRYVVVNLPTEAPGIP